MVVTCRVATIYRENRALWAVAGALYTQLIWSWVIVSWWCGVATVTWYHNGAVDWCIMVKKGPANGSLSQGDQRELAPFRIKRERQSSTNDLSNVIMIKCGRFYEDGNSIKEHAEGLRDWLQRLERQQKSKDKKSTREKGRNTEKRPEKIKQRKTETDFLKKKEGKYMDREKEDIKENTILHSKREKYRKKERKKMRQRERKIERKRMRQRERKKGWKRYKGWETERRERDRLIFAHLF